jgi:hypothetical protein
MLAPWFSPSLFEDSSPDLLNSEVDISTRSTTSAALEINRILYNLPSVSGPFIYTICETYVSNQRQRSDSEASVYQDCINAYESSDLDPYENNEENISSLGSNALTQLSQTGIETDGTKVSGSSRDTVVTYEVQEHLILLEYPDTADNGILHIIHASKNPFENREDTSSNINQVTSQLMLLVSLKYF